MAEISIGSAVGAGFQLIARKPLTVMAWGLVRVAFAGAVLAIYAPVFLAIFTEAIKNAQAGGGDANSQAAVAQMMPHMIMLQGVGYLAQLGGLLLSAVILCAVSRSIVRPERSAWAYLRVGPPEFYTAVLSFAAGIVVFLGLLVCIIPFAIVAAVLAANHQTAALVVVCVLAALALVVGLIYALLRLVFVVPMMVDDSQFHLFDAWSLTKGRVGSLFIIGLLLVVVVLVAEMIVGAILVALGVAALGVSAGGLQTQNLQAFFTLGPAVIAARLAPWLIVYAVLAIPLEGCATAILMAPWARAYRDVAPPAEPATATPPPATQPPAQPSPAVA